MQQAMACMSDMDGGVPMHPASKTPQPRRNILAALMATSDTTTSRTRRRTGAGGSLPLAQTRTSRWTKVRSRLCADRGGTGCVQSDGGFP